MQSSVKIVLNDNTSVFYAGQTVIGRVECMFASEKKIRAIRIKFQGIAKTRWSVKKRQRRTKFWAEEIYFDQEYTLVETRGGNNLRLSTGMHTYPFSYTLPHTLPTSFDDHYGTIKYKIKVIIDRPNKTNLKNKLPLYITPVLDLNILWNVREPFSHSVDGNASCLCFNSDSVTFAIFLPFTGYAASQEINVGSYVQNMTNANVTRVQYEVIRATLKMPFPHSDLKIACPIMLGTIPLMGLNTTMLGPPTQLEPVPTALPVVEDIAGSSHPVENVEDLLKKM